MNGRKKISTIKIIISLYILAIIVFLLLHFTSMIQSNITKSVLLGILYNLVNFSAAIVLFSISVAKSNKTFLILNFGGMVLRLMLMLAALIISIITLKIEQYAFIFTFLFFYVLSIGGEILYFHERQLKK